MASLVAHWAEQQCPMPPIPQMLERHCALPEQAAPAASPLVPPVVPPFVPAVEDPPVVAPPLVPPVEPVGVDELQAAAKSPATPIANNAAFKPRMRDPLLDVWADALTSACQ